MDNKRTKKINIIALVSIMLILLLAVIFRKQTVSYDLTGNKDSAVSLAPGETLVQTYSPNRRYITEFDFALASESELNGDYMLVVTDKGTPSDEPIYSITNTYTGETANSLDFMLPDKFNPAPGVRLNLFVKSDAGNTDTIELSSWTSFRSLYSFNEQTGEKTLGDSTLAVSIVSQKNYKWFLILYILLLTFGITFILMHFFKSDFEENLALSIMLSVFFAYTLGLMNILKAVPVILFIVSAVGIVLFFLDCNKKELPFYKCITNSMLLWGIVVLVLFVTIHHTYIGDPDSVFHINKAKYMFWTDKLAYSPRYIFFIPVFAHFFEIVNGIFSEDLFLIAIIIYEFAILFSFLNVIKVENRKKDFLFKALLLGLCTLLAIAIHPSAFFTAMMDVPFAITIAYIIRNLYVKRIDKEHLFRVIVSAIALVMIKRAGLPTVLIFALIIILHAIRFRKPGTKFDKRYLVAVLLLIFLCISTSKTIDFLGAKLTNMAPPEFVGDFVSAEEYRGIQSEDQSLLASLSSNLSDIDMIQPPALANNIALRFPIVQKIMEIDTYVIKKLMSAFFNTNIYFGFTYAECLAIILMIAAVTWLIKKDEEAFEFFKNMMELTVAALLYYGVIGYKYLFNIEEYNKYTLNAFDRYAIHFIGPVVLFEAISLIGVIYKESEEARNYLRLIVLTVVFMIITAIRPDFNAVTADINEDIVSIESNRDGLERALAIYSGYKHPITLYMPDETFDQAGYYTKRFNLECWASWVTINRRNVSTEEVMDDYIHYLYERNDYLYLVNYDEGFLDYAPVFLTDKGQGVMRHALYHINKSSDGAVSLEYLGQVPFDDYILRTPDGRERLSIKNG